MYFKRHLTFFFQRIIYHFKSIKYLFFVPVVMMVAVIPLLNLFSAQKFSVAEEAFADILKIDFMLFPVLSVWWSLFILKEYVEADGYELLYVCRNKIKLLDALLPFFLFLFIMGGFFFGYSFLLKDIWFEYFCIVCSCLFYFGLVYCLLFLTRSVTLTLMACLLYTLANLVFLNGAPPFPFYYTSQRILPNQLWSVYLPLAAAGCSLTGLGVALNIKISKFE